VNNIVDFSLIVPVYNVEEYISNFLESVLKQTIDNYEIIIIDNNSNDKSISIVNNYISKFKNILITEEKKQGVAASRNKGLEVAKGKWILFIDPDDTLEPKYLESFNAAMSENIDVAICGYRYIDYKTKRIINESNYEGLKNKNPELLIQTFTSQYQGFLWNKCFSKKIIDDNNLFFCEELVVMSDLPFVTQYLSNCNNCIFIDEHLYNYYRQVNSITEKTNKSSVFNKKKYLSKINSYNLVLDTIDGSAYEIAYHYSIFNKITILKQLKQNRFVEFIEFKKQYKREILASFYTILLNDKLPLKFKIRNYLGGIVLFVL